MHETVEKGAVAGGERDAELQRLVDEQTALRRVATLVAAGTSDVDLVAAVTSEVARLFGAHRAAALRWDGDTISVIGGWSADDAPALPNRDFSFGGDTLAARVVESGGPARVESADDLQTEFGRARWAELGIQASIGAPIVVDGRIWGVITASRTTADPFAAGAEHRLGDFAALVAQAIANTEARQQVAALADEQAALRRVATFVAGGKPPDEVLDAATREAGRLYGAQAVYLVHWEGVYDEVVVDGGWSGDDERALTPRALYHPEPFSATLTVLETGLASRGEERSPELGDRCVIAAPVIVAANLLGALLAVRPAGDAFPPGAEIRLRSFGDLVAQSIANAQAQEDLRASRARIVRAGDEARQKLERNLHDGAQQRLVSVSIGLRLALAKLPEEGADEAKRMLGAASDELTLAIEELRELARGIHPAVLTEQGLGVALEVLAERAPMNVRVANELEDRLPASVEAAAYYVVSESLTNCAKYAQASAVEVRVSRRDGVARVEVRDDGVGGADVSRGSGLRGLADRVEALDGRLGVDSAPSAGTRVWAEIPVAAEVA